MTRAAGFASKVLAVASILAYQVLVHFAIASGTGDPIRVALLAAPVVLVASWILLRSPNRAVWVLIIAAAVSVTVVLGQSAAALYGVPHAAGYLFMLWLFGRTLLGAREPFITRLARQAYGGAMPAWREVYTRRLTAAWCLFFAAQLLASALLLALASAEEWSFFINVLNLPLIALMFAVDYVYRVIRYRDTPASIAVPIRAYAKDRKSSFLPR